MGSMEHDRFDALAKKVFDNSSRRRVISGALASVLGVGVAAVTGVDAKNKKAKAQGTKGKGKGKTKGEFTCTAANANVPAQGGCQGGECCQSTPAGNNATCVGVFAQLNSQTCGDNAGQGVCRTCPVGTKCGIRNGALICICDSSTCATGCCIPGAAAGADEVCVQNGSGAAVNSANPAFDGQFVCGTAGSVCNTCGNTLFNGCCTATGACTIGTNNTNCGNTGQLCQTCLNDSTCGDDQACTGGTTTTTTAAPTTTLAPCAPPKKTCGTLCCGKKKKCVDKGDGTFKCKKK